MVVDFLTGEDAKALVDELNIARGENAQLRKEFDELRKKFDELVVELKDVLKKK